MAFFIRYLNLKQFLVYIDDIICFSKDFRTHNACRSIIHIVGITLTVKCEGLTYSKLGVSVNPQNTATINQTQVPKTIRQFIPINYYKRYIEVASPL